MNLVKGIIFMATSVILMVGCGHNVKHGPEREQMVT